MNGYGAYLAEKIDKQVELDDDEDGLRTHLGASVIGNKCLRSIWYQWKWSGTEEFPGRMLRLFERGQNSEQVFATILRSLKAMVWTEDENGVQYRVAWWGGHLGGSMDGVACHLPDLPPEVPHGAPVLLEMKTHNEKSFAKLKKEGLRVSKPEHYKQSQLYMHGTGIKWCLYIAVNKNTDEIFCCFFAYDAAVGEHLVNRAELVIFGDGTPPRISNKPDWFECRFCKVRDICFGYKMPFVNCRTCKHSTAERDGTWSCGLGKGEIKSCPKQGCELHTFNPALFPHATVIEESQNFVTYQLKSGNVVTNGPLHTTSDKLDLTC